MLISPQELPSLTIHNSVFALTDLIWYQNLLSKSSSIDHRHANNEPTLGCTYVAGPSVLSSLQRALSDLPQKPNLLHKTLDQKFLLKSPKKLSFL